MLKLTNLIFLVAFLFSANAFAVGKIQDEGVKSLAEILSAGGTAAQLINDNKIYSAILGKQLSAAIADGSVCTNCTASTGLKGLIGLIIISDCASPYTISSASLIDFSAQTGCTYTLVNGQGTPSAPATMIPAIKFATLAAGEYSIEFEGLLVDSSPSGSSGVAKFQFWDGTNTARELSGVTSPNNAVAGTPGIKQSIKYSTTQSNVTLSLRAMEPSAAAQAYCTTATPCTIRLYGM